MADDDMKTMIGPGSGIQFSLLIVVLGAVAGGGIWIGKSASEFDTLKNLVYEIRADVRGLSEQVRKLPKQ